MHPLQEKFQILSPGKIEDGENWVSAESVRDLRGMKNSGEFNKMPPGTDIANQYHTQQENMPLSMAGAADVSHDTTPKAMLEGFTRRDMKGTDDQYTGEHVDLFYGDAGGFAERNNYLDRL